MREALQAIGDELTKMTPEDHLREEPAVRLTPPPRVGGVGTGEGGSKAASPRRRLVHPRSRRWRWLTAASFGVLIIAALAVFVLLPRWVENNPGLGLGPTAGSLQPGAGEEGSEPIESAATGVEAPVSSRVASGEAPVAPTASGSASAGAPAKSSSPPPEPQRVRPEAAPGRQESGTSPQTDGAYAEHMSAGLAALQRGDHAVALEAFTLAESLSPDSAQAIEGRARAEQGLRLDAIAGHRERALAAEAAEDWDAAGREYDSVLRLDPALRFAQEGKSRVLERGELAKRLNFHIDHPERLATEGVLEDAAALVERAQTVRPAGPVLSEQIVQLERLVTLYGTPVRIHLLSDSLTEVSINRVGRLGRFDRRILELRPGTYTAVGRREGYRDVRRQFRVMPEAAAEPLVVRCEEKI